MVSHPSDSQLHDLIDEQLQHEDFLVVTKHLEHCEQCRARVQSTRDLVKSLKLLPRDAHFLPDFDEYSRSTKSVRTLFFSSRLLTAVAAIVILGVGITIGLWTGKSSRLVTPQSINPGPEQLAEEIQRSGSEYVTALAILRRRYGLASDGNQGRQAAIAALYGAAFELQRLEPSDVQIRTAVQSIEALQNRDLFQQAPDAEGGKP